MTKMGTEQTNNLNKNKSNFLIQGSILAVAGIIVRIIGLAYRIPLIRIIGDEGMGYYSVAFEVYSVILLLSSYSLPLAVSKMISARIAKEDYVNAHRIFKAALLYATIIGAAGCAFVFFTAEWFANVFYMLPLCKYALISLAPTIWIMAYLGVMRGYYQGQSTMVPTAISQILEQIVNAVVSICAAWFLCNMALKAAETKSVSVAYGAAGGTIGTGAGALTALLVLVFMCTKTRKEWKDEIASSETKGIIVESYKSLSITLLMTVIPVILSSGIYNISGIIDGRVFSSTMITKFGIDASHVAAEYGAFTGRFKTLCNIPIAISNSLSSSVIPVMSRASTEGNKDLVDSSISKAMKFTTIIAFPASVGLTVIGGPVIALLFGKSDLAMMMTGIGSFAILFFSVSTISNAVLQGTGYLWKTVIHSAISLCIHIASLWFMLNAVKLGIKAVVIAHMIFAASQCVLNAITIRNKLGYRQELKTTYLLPLVSSLVMGVVTYFVLIITRKYISKSNLVICILCIGAAVIVYGAMLILTKCLTKKELKAFPVIGKLIK